MVSEVHVAGKSSADRRGPVLVVIAIALLVCAALIAMSFSKRTSDASLQWYFDLGTQQLFTARAGQIPPIDAPSGKSLGVRAYRFSCGECTDAGTKTYYLETVTPEARAIMEDHGSNADPNIAFAGTLIAQPPEEDEEPTWCSAASPQAAQIQSRPQQDCPGAIAHPCNPS